MQRMVDILRSVGQQLRSFLPVLPLRSFYDAYVGKPDIHASIRRVVTGHNLEGLGTLVQDNEIIGQSSGDPGCEGLRGGTLWVTESVPSKDNNISVDGSQRQIGGQGLVMRNGTNFRFTDLAPGTSSPMHRTSSIDYNILIWGKVICVMEDGSETLLETPGDSVVMKGGMHAWRNPGTKWTRWVSVLVDAEPVVINDVKLEDSWLA